MSSDNAGVSIVPDHAPETLRPDKGVKPIAAADDNKLDWKSTAYGMAKFLLRGVRDTADTFGPLKTVAGGLCFILDNCDVRPSSRTLRYPQCLEFPQQMKANKQALESLAHRVKALAESLCSPVSEGDIKEESRRNILGR